MYTVTATGPTSGAVTMTFTDAPAQIDLDQARNGTAASPVSPVNFQNGNAGPSQAHYAEGMSIPYRVRLDNLPLNTPITVTLSYAVRDGFKSALDYLTSYNRLEPHVATFGHAAEVVDPILVGTAATGTPVTADIPAPGSAGSQPYISFMNLAAGERQMSLWGAMFGAERHRVPITGLM